MRTFVIGDRVTTAYGAGEVIASLPATFGTRYYVRLDGGTCSWFSQAVIKPERKPKHENRDVQPV